MEVEIEPLDCKAKDRRDNLLADCTHEFLVTQYNELGYGMETLNEKETVDACILIEKKNPFNRATLVRLDPLTNKYYSSGCRPHETLAEGL